MEFLRRWTRRATGRRVLTPIILQGHATECGVACLGIVLGYFGRWVSLSELREACRVGRDGSTLAELKRAAESYDIECTGWALEIGPLQKMSLPLILFWEFHHFVVLEGSDRNWYYLNDPATGRRRVSPQEFRRSFTGVALRPRPGPEFRPSGRAPKLADRLPQWLEGAWSKLAYGLACAFLVSLLTLSVPFAAKVFIDDVAGRNPTWWGFLVVALALAGVLTYGLVWLKERFLRRLEIRLSVVFGDLAVTRLLRLPISYFSNRMAGDLALRVASIDRIANGLCEHVFGRLIDVAMCAVFLVAMLIYDPRLALIVLALALVGALVLRPLERLRSDLAAKSSWENGTLAGLGAMMLSHAEPLRMTAADDGVFNRWSGCQARALQANQRFFELNAFVAASPRLFTTLGIAAVLAVGGGRVMAGELTPGGLAWFYLMSGLFFAPVGRFVEFGYKRQFLLADMLRLDDICKATEDPNFQRRTEQSDKLSTIQKRLTLTGHVELRGLTFGYNPNQPPLLKGFDLVIKPGQRVAVVGPSGSGKSTLARLVAGVLQPWSGEILFDGQRRQEIAAEVLSRSISMVNQDVVLFSGTVADNLTLWNPAVPEDDLKVATRDAGIHDEIMARPLGFETEVDEGGNMFSGGQRQRLQIARALVGNPTFLVLDEATSSLDAKTELHVDDALRRRGVSCLIVAHALSTVRDCDAIVVLDRGVEVQRGTHEELMGDADGLYRHLVRTEFGG